MPVDRLILSVFPGIDLLGLAFEGEGYCVVRGPDLVWGWTVETFQPPCGVFGGVIGGTPCQDFSCARRIPATGEGERMLDHFLRIVLQASPDWFLLENVPGVPDVNAIGYAVQRLNVRDWEFGGSQRRLRTFQFGSRDGGAIVLDRRDTPAGEIVPTVLATEGERSSRRSWGDFCALQGLPRDFDLPGMTRSAKYRAVGNAVSLATGRAIARAVTGRGTSCDVRSCVCGCGRPVTGNGSQATAGCRKRMERRRRRSATVTNQGQLQPGRSP